MTHQKKYVFEACTNSIRSALNAQAGGADRVELCANLEVGGITPSFGFIQMAKEILNIPVHVLIRPRPGNFIYTDTEFAIMLGDIQACSFLGCEGVVVGMLNGDHQVDVTRMRQLMVAASPMQVTFHRAFDDTISKKQALEEIIDLGCSRLLTVGGENSLVHNNAANISDLIAQADDRIIIMPGRGLTPQTLYKLAKTSGAVEFHGSASRRRTSGGQVKIYGAYTCERDETNLHIVREIVGVLRSLENEDNGEHDSAPPAYE